MENKIFVLIFVVVVFILGGLLYIYNPEPIEYSNPNEEQEVVCTQDVMLCPDGSYVGRTGPNCEFKACSILKDTIMEDGTIPDKSTSTPVTPEEESLVACTMDAKMCPDGSYVGRIGPKCEFAKCP